MKTPLRNYIKTTLKIDERGMSIPAWDNQAEFAKHHDLSPQHLNTLIDRGYYVKNRTVYTPKGKKAFIDGVEFKIRGIE